MMTRINVIPVRLLSDEHLGAEYRELPRVFGEVRAAQDRGEIPSSIPMPFHYKLGEGHVRFFYNKLDYLLRRYAEICRWRWYRGFQVNYPDLAELTERIEEEWFNDWIPDIEAQRTNLFRLIDREPDHQPYHTYLYQLTSRTHYG